MNEIGIVVETEQGTFVVDANDQFVGKQIREEGCFNPSELQFLKTLVNNKTNVLWLGAHIGSLMIPIAHNVKHITAIEANPDTYKLLKMNIKINNLNNVEVFNVAAGEEFGYIEFIKNKINSGGSKRKPFIANDIYYYDNPDIVEVPLKRMDEFLTSNFYDFIFMDIEGSEYFALKGMPKILNKASILVMEFMPFHLRDVANIEPKEMFELLMDFKTMIVPSLKKIAYDNDILNFLNYMFDNNHCENGILFLKEKHENIKFS